MSLLDHQRCPNLLPVLSLWLLAAGQFAAVLGQTESSLLDPQYYNLAPCPCDLQPSVCDVGCCCDSVCSASDKLLFSCAQGFYGGNTTVELYRMCSSTDRDNPDYHPFTCVLIENYNAYLGMYFAVQTAVSDRSSWTARQLTASADDLLYQFPTDAALGLVEASLVAAQRKDLILLEIPNGTTPYWVDNSQMANYRLSLPQRILAGGCDRSAGVAYLDDSTSACDVTITANLCQSGVASPLDAGVYATDCSSSVSCQALVQTRSTAGSAGNAATVPVTVTYRILSTASEYQKGLTAASTVTTGTRQPPSLSGTVCNNSVVEVQYRFVWSGSTVVSLAATVYLAPVTLGSVVTQRYSAAFSHLAGISGGSTIAVQRSGLVGYEPGARLIGGVRASSGGSVNSSSGYRPSLWKASSAGACQTGVAGDPVLFQMDATSYCTQQVQLADFSDCDTLRERLRVQLRSQFPAGVIGIFGSANTTVSADWITVLEQGLTNYTGQNFSNTANSTPVWTTLTGVCLGIPTEIVLTVLYAEQGKANDSSIWQVVGAYLRYKQVHLSAVCGPTGCTATSLAMSTGVQFIRVPPGWADSDQAFFGPYKMPCWWGICWEELAYPLTTDFEGESRAMCIAWCIFLTLIAVYAFCISRPWW